VSACTLSNNNTHGYGGGIYNTYPSHATLTITGCTLSGNTANDGSGFSNSGLKREEALPL
jgi:hypothetical protein